MPSDIVSLLLVASRVNHLFEVRPVRSGFPILAYHDVPGRVLETHIDALAPHYRFMSLEDALSNHRPQRARPPLVLTFDDGYRSWATEVAPVLAKRQIPAIFFPCTAFLDGNALPWFEVLDRFVLSCPEASLEIGKREFRVRDLERDRDLRRKLNRHLKSLPPPRLEVLAQRMQDSLSQADLQDIRDRLLSWEDLKGMSGPYLEVGSHTRTHPILARLSGEDLRDEVHGTKARLEAELQRPVRYFAYPNGTRVDLNDVVVKAVAQAGFEHALTAMPGWNSPETDPYRLRRAVVAPQGTIWRLKTSASGLLGYLEQTWRRIRG